LAGVCGNDEVLNADDRSAQEYAKLAYCLSKIGRRDFSRKKYEH
jgi:hypothetical protein